MVSAGPIRVSWKVLVAEIAIVSGKKESAAPDAPVNNKRENTPQVETVSVRVTSL